MGQGGQGLLGHFHFSDIVRGSTAVEIRKHPVTGIYLPCEGMEKLVGFFGPCTLGFYLGNPAYAALMVQGQMGIDCLAAECERQTLSLTPATEATYAAFGLSPTEAQYTNDYKWGLHIVGRGEQLVCTIPSLGSALMGNASWGSAAAVVSVTNCCNMLVNIRARA